MDINFFNEVWAVFLSELWIFTVMLVCASRDSTLTQRTHDIVLALLTVAGVGAIAFLCGAPIVGTALILILALSFDSYFDILPPHRY